jgi:hypothetical protein
MAIGKRTWKTWIVRYRDAAGNYRQKTFKSKRDAEAWVALINAEMRSPDAFALDDR